MNSPKSRNLIFILAVLFAAGFTSCSQKEKGPEKITFTFFSSDLMEYTPFTDLTAQEITRRTGVTLETQFCHSNSSDEISLMIANDQFPDLIYAKGDLSRLIEAGAVIPLDEYIEKYGENLKKLYGDQIVKLKYSLSDPQVYSVGTFEIKNKVLETAGNIQLQHAVLKELGYPKIKTLEDLENALLAYKTKYPQIDGKDTLGYSFLADSWYWYLSLSNPGGYLIGHPDDGQWFVDEESLVAMYKFLDKDMPLFYRWLNKIYHEGLLDIESFTQKEDVWQSKVKEGRVLATSYPYWGLSSLRSNLAANGMDERTFAYLPVTAGPEYKDQSLKDYGFSGGWGIAITKSCKNPEKAFKFLDYMCSEEGQILLNWGIKNVTYFEDISGKRVLKSEIPGDSGLGAWVYPFPQAGKGAYDSRGDSIANLSLGQIRKDYLPAERETLSAYGVEMWTDLFPTSQELGVSRHGQAWQYNLSPESQTKLTKIDDFVKESLIHMILGPESDFENNWQDMVRGIKNLGIESVTLELNRMIAEKMELWSR